MGRCWLVLGGTGPVLGSPGWFVVVIGQYGAVLVGTWWYWVSVERRWLVCGRNGSVWGGVGWYLVILGQYNLVLFVIKWYFVNKGLLCLYILKKLMVTSTNRPTDRQGECRAILLFRKLENREKQRFAISSNSIIQLKTIKLSSLTIHVMPVEFPLDNGKYFRRTSYLLTLV